MRVLATSRERLRVDGEVTWRVPSLSLPETEATVDQIAESEAVQLFVERARLVRPEFRPDEQSHTAVSHLCRRLDGIPLPIELAAARLSVLTVEQIDERMSDALRLLTGGSRSAPTRHQTLRATLDWSHNLLSLPEQVTLRRLAVFAGGWTIEAAESVIAGEAVARQEVFDLVSALIERSLVQVEHGGGFVRYRLQETVRQYARDHLDRSNETTAIQERHAEYFTALADVIEPAMRGAEQVQWAARCDADLENLRAALAWVCADGRTELGLRLGWGLWRYWQLRGYGIEARHWLRGILELPTGGASRELRTGVLFAAARNALLLGETADAMALAQSCLIAARAFDD
ncbi:MAG: ATP-binding protein, partial [Vicinamibacterales bacterium]